MSTADKISKLGFKRWYERQLIESHAYLVTCFLSLILVVASLEVFGGKSSVLQAFLEITLAFFGGALCIFTLGRYKQALEVAERLGDHATCEKCRAYAAFSVIASGPRAADPSLELEYDPLPTDRTWLRVRCRKCGNEWTM